MKKINLFSLGALWLFLTCASAILTWGFYGRLMPVSPFASITMWVLACVSFVAARRIRKNIEKGTVGLDSSQLNPLSVAQWLIIGKACAWCGAIMGGVYSGIATFVVPHALMLAAAADDLPGTLITVAGAVAMTVAGLYLESSCEAPPRDGHAAASA